MLVLRLVRTGRRNQPKFRLVAADQSEKLDGKVVEILGHYEPAAKDKPFVFDKEKVQGWLAKGGMPSNTVAKLLNMNGFDLPVHKFAEGKPRKKAQARLDEANKPAEALVAVAEAPAEASGEDVESPAEAAIDVEPAEEVAAEEPAVAEVVPAEEAAPVVEEPTEETTSEEESK